MAGSFRVPTGVFRVERARGPAWYVKYRLPDGRQVQKKLGPAWTERGRPPAGYFTKRLAEDALRRTLEEARRGTLPGMVRTGATFTDAVAEYLRYVEHDRGLKPSTLRGYRSAIEAHLLPAFGELPVEEVTTASIEQWLAGFAGSVRSRNKPLIQLHGSWAVLAGSTGSWETRQPKSKSSHSARAARSRCSRPRRCGPSCGRLLQSRTVPCS
jgi:hypothetical protein